jgi:Asp-tRNA(Asn)/Glu-tRNA(Gln) amidotransferase A subunit family amidase
MGADGTLGALAEAPMSDLLRRPLAEITALLASRELSPVELMDTTLDRIDAVNDKLGAFVAMRERDAILADARAAEARIQRGEARPLEGVPLGVKDLEDAAGLVTSHGSRVYKDNLVSRDSIQVERLRAAGAIVVGKTNAPEFGHTAITKNLLFPESRNPWNLERTPGGSSGGSSAAIAGSMIPLATASDGGGSVRIPATFTGCFGLKPSYGRIPHGPDKLWVMDDTAGHGPLTRTVEDAALHLDATVGVHPLDPNSLPHPGLSYRDVLTRLPAGLRIGYADDLGYAVVQSDVADVVGDAVHVFEQLGHSVDLVRGGPPEPGRDWGLMGLFLLLGQLDEYLPDREDEFGRGLINNVKLGAQMNAVRFASFRSRREELNRWCDEIFQRYDLLVTPTVPYDPPAARGPLLAEVEGRRQPEANVGSFTMPFNLSWHPAATVRCGFSRARLPVGLQIVGPRHRDDLVMQASYAFEQARPWAHDWPTV